MKADYILSMEVEYLNYEIFRKNHRVAKLAR